MSGKAKKVGKYELCETIGRGTFSKVKRGINTETGEVVAIKIINITSLQKEGMEKQMKREISVLKSIQHENVVTMIEVLKSSNHFYIVMELITGGELFDKIVSVKKFDEKVARRYFQQLIDGLSYCHKKGIAHRDLKPENLLLGKSDTLKISDFGLSGLAGDNKMLSTICGTPHYVAPEVLSGSYDGISADIWSLGIILFVMLSGCFERGTKVLMNDGSIKLVENIKEGDLVLGPNDKPRKVLELFSGLDEMYEITERTKHTEKNKESTLGIIKFSCNSKHLLSVSTPNYIKMVDSKIKDRLYTSVTWHSLDDVNIPTGKTIKLVRCHTKRFFYESNNGEKEAKRLSKELFDEKIEERKKTNTYNFHWLIEAGHMKYLADEKVKKSTYQICQPILIERKDLRQIIVETGIDDDIAEKTSWLLGIWLEDGCTNNSTIAVDTRDHELHEEIQHISSILDLSTSKVVSKKRKYPTYSGDIKINSQVDFCNGKKCLTTNNCFWKLIQSLDMNKPTKNFPEWFKTQEISLREYFIAGLIDSNGHVELDSFGKLINASITTIYVSICENLCELARSLGLKTSVDIRNAYIDKEGCEHKKSYAIKLWKNSGFCLESILSKCVLPRKKIDLKCDVTRSPLNIYFNCKLSKIDEYFGFSVEKSPDHLFMLGNGVICHNCHPFDGDSVAELFNRIENLEFKYPNYFTKGARALLDKIIVVDPKKRATMEDIKNDPWFKKGYKGDTGARKSIKLNVDDLNTIEEASVEFEKENMRNVRLSVRMQHSEPLNAFEIITQIAMKGRMNPLASKVKSKTSAPSVSYNFAYQGLADEIYEEMISFLSSAKCETKTKDTSYWVKCRLKGINDVEFSTHVSPINNFLSICEFVKIRGNTLKFQELFRLTKQKYAIKTDDILQDDEFMKEKVDKGTVVMTTQKEEKEEEEEEEKIEEKKSELNEVEKETKQEVEVEKEIEKPEELEEVEVKDVEEEEVDQTTTSKEVTEEEKLEQD